MRTKTVFAAVAALSMAPTLVPATAFAQRADDRRYDERRYDERRSERTYRGEDGRYYPCKRSSGTTGLVAGGVGGAVVGNALGGGVLGTVAGGVGGALLGKHLDKKHDAAQNRRNGC